MDLEVFSKLLAAVASALKSAVDLVKALPPNRGRAPAPRAKITEPAHGAVVSSPVPVVGSASGLPADGRIWTAVHTGGLFWPQAQAVVVGDEREASWTAQASLGRGDDTDHGNAFDILAVLADSEAEKVFVPWLDRGQGMTRGARFPGLSALPRGARILDRVTVTLR